MRHALLRQGYVKAASAQHLWSSGTTILRLGRWFRSTKKRALNSLKQGLRTDPSRLASNKERREVGSVSPHPSPISSNELGKEGRPEVAIKLKC